jgi:hypothetical protein
MRRECEEWLQTGINLCVAKRLRWPTPVVQDNRHQCVYQQSGLLIHVWIDLSTGAADVKYYEPNDWSPIAEHGKSIFDPHNHPQPIGVQASCNWAQDMVRGVSGTVRN